jgi:Sec-independent protein secretion pathway component TatC
MLGLFMSDDFNEKNIDSSAAPLVEHLAELRVRLMKAAGFFILGIIYLLFDSVKYI